jgi:hypothetical protein
MLSVNCSDMATCDCDCVVQQGIPEFGIKLSRSLALHTFTSLTRD